MRSVSNSSERIRNSHGPQSVAVITELLSSSQNNLGIIGIPAFGIRGIN